MIIANPLYDVVFKYLLEDLEIARELLAIILGQEVLSIEVKPQETIAENAASSIRRPGSGSCSLSQGFQPQTALLLL
ncbi:MAG: hypothetical protein EAZ32_04550 [Cytophagia bacterium]|nr:MAG: hypothetical protein EAZ38_07580 [Cytophagales bacterium]TAG41061.1 MAG: hypothetical protein EAZ32_04550 [Cytophagia bacterium]TAG52120.1 MAG: hypothetical protein EAZ29_08155 [Runella slithyformis]TAG83854.1 MAG: hypothetical protein EAZ22_01585 [Cytophagales bacterium]